MAIDFCIVSTSIWLLIDAASVIIGGAFGYMVAALIARKARTPLSRSAPHYFGGCLLPLIAAAVISYAVYLSVPDDPCGGAFTDDGQFIPLITFLIIGLGGVISFWVAAWRKL